MHRALLQNLLHDVFLIARAELVLENAVRGTVEDALAALLVRDEDLPPVHDLSQRHRLIVLPALYRLYALDKDHEVVLGALVVHLGLRVVSASHDGCSL